MPWITVPDGEWKKTHDGQYVFIPHAKPTVSPEVTSQTISQIGKIGSSDPHNFGYQESPDSRARNVQKSLVMQGVEGKKYGDNVFGRAHKGIDQYLASHVDELAGWTPGSLNPNPDQNPLVNQPWMPEMAAQADEGNLHKIARAIDTNVFRPMTSPVGALGTFMGADPHEYAPQAPEMQPQLGLPEAPAWADPGPFIDVSPSTSEPVQGLHAQNQLARIGSPEPIPTQFEPTVPESIPNYTGDQIESLSEVHGGIRQGEPGYGTPPPSTHPYEINEVGGRLAVVDTNTNRNLLITENPDEAESLIRTLTEAIDVTPSNQPLELPPESDAELVNQSFEQPVDKQNAIQAAQTQMGQATQESIPVDPQVTRATELEHLNSTPDREEVRNIFNHWIDQHRQIRESGGMGTPEQEHAWNMFNAANERLQNWGQSTPTPQPELQTELGPIEETEPVQTEAQPQTGLSWQPNEAADRQQILDTPREGVRLHDLHHSWYNRFNEAYEANQRDQMDYAYSMMQLVNNAIESPPAEAPPPEREIPEVQGINPEPIEDSYLEDEWGEIEPPATQAVTTAPNRWQVAHLDDPDTSVAEYATQDEAQQHLHNNPHEMLGYRELTGTGEMVRPPHSPLHPEGMAGDLAEINEATTAEELNQLYRDWNEGYQHSRTMNDDASMEHARNMAIRIDERLTNEFNQPESLGFGSPNPPSEPTYLPGEEDLREVIEATTLQELEALRTRWNTAYNEASRGGYTTRDARVHAYEMLNTIEDRMQESQFDTPGGLDLTQRYHVYDPETGEVVATFPYSYEAREYTDLPANQHLDYASRGNVPPATGVRKKTMTELREATGVPNPPITFGQQDLTIITDLTEAQIARLRGGAGKDSRIDKKGRKDPAIRKVEDAGYDDMAKRALAATPVGTPGLTITDSSYGSSHKTYRIVFRGADGKAQALATVEEDPDGWRKVPWLMADRRKGGKPAMYVMSAIAKMNATEQSGSISDHTANIIAQLTQRKDKLSAREARIAARKKREATEPPPED